MLQAVSWLLPLLPLHSHDCRHNAFGHVVYADVHALRARPPSNGRQVLLLWGPSGSEAEPSRRGRCAKIFLTSLRI
jgi:hypothetical protein